MKQVDPPSGLGDVGDCYDRKLSVIFIGIQCLAFPQKYRRFAPVNSALIIFREIGAASGRPGDSVYQLVIAFLETVVSISASREGDVSGIPFNADQTNTLTGTSGDYACDIRPASPSAAEFHHGEAIGS